MTASNRSESAAIFETAISYTHDGCLTIIPILLDQTKRPAWDRLPKSEDGRATWKPFQNRIPIDEELQTFFGSNSVGIAIVCGNVSGWLEDIDFDDLGAYKDWNDLLINQGHKELLDRLMKVSTPRPGVAVLYRCPSGIEGNQKLACRLTDGEEKSLIETRGEGGYFVAPGSPLEVHKNKKPYEVKRGDICNIPVITAAERRLLLDAARSLNEYVEPAKTHTPKPAAENNGNRPGDHFAARTTWAEILGPAGWKLIYERGDVGYWRRPGKSEGWSATSNYGGSGLLYIFLSSTKFEHEHSYSKFAVYAVLNHNGDFGEAAKELAGKGYGEQRKANKPVRYGTFQSIERRPGDLLLTRGHRAISPNACKGNPEGARH